MRERETKLEPPEGLDWSAIVSAVGPAAAEPPNVVVPEIPDDLDDHDAGAIVRHAFASSVDQLIRHLPGAGVGDDPEHVHQARVALRRLRSDLRTFAPLLDRAWADDLRRRAKWLADALGHVRDDDVHIEIISRAGASDSVVEVLRDERDDHRGALLVALHKPRTRQLLAALVDAANEPVLLPAAGKRAEKALLPLVRKRWKRLRRAVASLPHDPSTGELHRIRILTKRCRYATMATAPALAQPALTFAKRLGKLQDVLGDVHDFELLAHRLREIALALPSEHAFSAGETAGRLRQMADESRDVWPGRWSKCKQVAPDQL